MIGETIAHYRITGKLGEGGMGEVYRARDTRLDRDVAIKILPAAFAADADRMARFEREAKVLASLNHPNIAHIYGVEERALVMELVEGVEPAGPLAFDEAWKIASQIADALEYAHDKGVIHRDLKPANVKVTPEGVVKLLDFGLAKAFGGAPDAAGSDPVNSPTLTLGATVAGTIMGTAAYMAPEQAKGKRVDKRADIWSWGVVLFELLTGQRMFQGEDAADTLAQVLTKEPDLGQVPEQVRKLLRRCLEKDPMRRLRDIGAARDLLESGSEVRAPAKIHGKLPWALAAVLAAIAAAVSFIHFLEAPAQKAVLRYTITPPENTTDLHSFAISPDGRLLAMAAMVNGKRQLWLRPLDALQARAVPGTDDATYPFWSPDSGYIGFFAQGKLKKIAAGGGPAQSICDAPNARGGSWNRDNVIVFDSGITVGAAIQRVLASGEAPADAVRNKGTSLFPAFLPDGRHFLYVVVAQSAEQNGIYLASLDGKENRRILPDISSAVPAAGNLLFIRENTVMAQPFDTKSAQIRGSAFPVAEAISRARFYVAPITASETGVLLYQSGRSSAGNQMFWYDRGGKALGTVGAPGPVLAPAISPDEKSVMFDRVPAGESDIWVRDLVRGAERRLTTAGAINGMSFWSPTGDRIAFGSNRASDVFNLYRKEVSAMGPDVLLLKNGNTKIPTQWSRDGRFLVYSELDPKTKWDVWVLPMEGEAKGKPLPFLRSEFNELSGQLSPDSHWMAYTSDDSGQREVYVRPFPAGEGESKVSIAGGDQPRWRGDGKELFFLGVEGSIMAVSVKAAMASQPGIKPSIELGVPQPLFDGHLAPAAVDAMFMYDVTADGKRFLLDSAASGSTSVSPLNVWVNWDAGLKK
ncbi:MAG TPA: protein kinase [Bryobacteraceae bacterium]|nr:protein kinase [Bryobacteraceae bacterium]